LVGDEQDAAPLAGGVEPVPPLLRRRQPTDGLDRLRDEPRGLGMRVEDRLDPIEALDPALRARAGLAAIRVRRGDAVVVGPQRLTRGFAVLLVRGDLERAEREAMIAVLEVRDVGLIAMLPRELERDLVGLRATGRKERLVDRLGSQADQL